MCSNNLLLGREAFTFAIAAGFVVGGVICFLFFLSAPKHMLEFGDLAFWIAKPRIVGMSLGFNEETRVRHMVGKYQV